MPKLLIIPKIRSEHAPWESLQWTQLDMLMAVTIYIHCELTEYLLHQEKFTKLPIAEISIAELEQLSKEEGQPCIQD